MRPLECLVIGDPSEEAAQHIAEQTRRLANERIVVTDCRELLARVKELSPEIVLFSFELDERRAVKVAGELVEANPDSLVVVTFRELPVQTLNELDGAGVEHSLSQPLDYTQLFRAASNRFNRGFRRHARFSATLEVYRPDGVMIGKTLDISEGGMRLECIQGAEVGGSFLTDIHLPDDRGEVRVRFDIIAVDGAAPKTVIARGQFDNLRGDAYRKLTTYLADLGDAAELED